MTRVAHGVSAIEDPSLVEELRRRDVTLDMCPTSNVQAGAAASLAEHPLAALHRAGVSVTISTDDLTVTGTTLSAEMAHVAAALSLTRAELSSIAVNAFARAFAPQRSMEPVHAAARTAWEAWRDSPIS